MSDDVDLTSTSSYKCFDDESEGSELAEKEVEEFDSFGVPKVVKHHVIFGAQANVWQFFHKLAVPYETKKTNLNRQLQKPFTHLCLLCLKKIG
jgi:hypothetical protein